MDKENPKINHLQNCLKRIEQVINITNGIPVLTVNLQKLYNIIKCTINLQKYIFFTKEGSEISCKKIYNAIKEMGLQ